MRFSLGHWALKWSTQRCGQESQLCLEDLGTVQVLIDETADVESAVSSLLLSKTFDNGMICAAEQTLVVVDAVYNQVCQALQNQGAHFLSADEAKILATAMRSEGSHMNRKMVGKSVPTIASLASLQVPSSARVLVGEADPTLIGNQDPWSCEKMAPILGLYRAKNYDSAVEICSRLVQNGGEGHVAVLHTSPAWREWKNEEDRVWKFQKASSSWRGFGKPSIEPGCDWRYFQFQKRSSTFRPN